MSTTYSEADQTAYESRTGDTEPLWLICTNEGCGDFGHGTWSAPTRWGEADEDELRCPECGQKGELL